MINKCLFANLEIQQYLDLFQLISGQSIASEQCPLSFKGGPLDYSYPKKFMHINTAKKKFHVNPKSMLQEEKLHATT